MPIYDPESSRARQLDRNTIRQQTYNPTTGEWTERTVEDYSKSLDDKADELISSMNSGGNSESSGNEASKMHTSEGKATKDFIEKEFFTLQGDLTIIATKKTIKIKAGDTVSINGVGKYLSGQYFVDSVERKIDNSSGYTHSLSVQKNGFADGLKKGSPSDKAEGKTDANINKDRPNSPALVHKDISRTLDQVY